MADQSRFFLATAQQRIGEKIGVSPWVFIDQTQVNVFGEVTRWRTPGHCEPEYAKNTLYGGTLLHGFHAISLITHFYKSSELWPEDGPDPLNLCSPFCSTPGGGGTAARAGCALCGGGTASWALVVLAGALKRAVG